MKLFKKPRTHRNYPRNFQKNCELADYVIWHMKTDVIG